MNKKVKVLMMSIIAVIGLLFTTDASAKVCNYKHGLGPDDNEFDSSGSMTYINIKVVYDSSQVCYNITGTTEGDVQTCFNLWEHDSKGTSKMSVTNKIGASEWNSNSECRDLYVARIRNIQGEHIITFTNQSESINLGSKTKIAEKATFVSSTDKLKVTIVNPDGTKQFQEVEFKGKVSEGAINIPTDIAYDKKFKCWAESGKPNCYDFNTEVKNDLRLYAITTNEYTTDEGFKNIGDKEVLCNGYSIPYGLPYMIYRIINLIKIITPIILIILGLIDFSKSVIAGNEDEMKKSTTRFIKRVIAAIIIFFVIAMVQFAFNLLGDNDAFSCFSCFVSGEDCNIVTKE